MSSDAVEKDTRSAAPRWSSGQFQRCQARDRAGNGQAVRSAARSTKLVKVESSTSVGSVWRPTAVPQRDAAREKRTPMPVPFAIRGRAQ